MARTAAVLTLLGFLCLTPACEVRAAQDMDRVRAAMIFTLTKFVRWPDTDASATFRLCIVGKDSVVRHLTAIEGKSVKGRNIVVERHGNAQPGCHVQVIAASRKTVETFPGTLTIGSHPEFLDVGGMIAIVEDQNKLVFDVNLEAAQAQNLDISSEALGLARHVR